MSSKEPLSPGGSCAHPLTVSAGRQKFRCLPQSQVLCLTDSEHSKHSGLGKSVLSCCVQAVSRVEASSASLPPGFRHGRSWVHLWLSPSSRLTPGASLIERIQAIAQNVSDIAVKVDQILRHSLILHSKGASQPGHCPVSPEASALRKSHFSGNTCLVLGGLLEALSRDLVYPTLAGGAYEVLCGLLAVGVRVDCCGSFGFGKSRRRLPICRSQEKQEYILWGARGVSICEATLELCVRAALSLEEAEQMEQGSSLRHHDCGGRTGGVTTALSYHRPLHLAPSLGLPPGPSVSVSHLLFFAVSEGRRDQCEAPSDPKFPDCSGKVEVRPRGPP